MTTLTTWYDWKMGSVRIAGIVVGTFGVAVGLYVIWHWGFVDDNWTAEQMDPWMLTSLLSFIIGVALFFWPRRKDRDNRLMPPNTRGKTGL